MKILFVSRKFPPSIGGMELFAYDLYCSLSKITEVTLLKWGGSNKALPIVWPYLFVRSILNMIFSDIDVIHMQDGVMAPIGLVMSKLFRKPYVVVLHGLDITYGNWFYVTFFLPAIRRANLVVCISQAAAEQAIERGVDKLKIEVKPIAVSDKFYHKHPKLKARGELDITADSYVILTVGRLVKRKGVNWFIREVMPELIKHQPNVIYLVVGGGPEQSTIESSVAELGLEQNVRLLGRVDERFLSMAYNASDIFVMPNVQVSGDIEGFGLVLLEASMSALPIVASDIEGIKDAITNGKNGILVSSGEPAAFTREINSYIADKDLSQSFGINSREYTKKQYSWSAIAHSYISSYKNLQ